MRNQTDGPAKSTLFAVMLVAAMTFGVLAAYVTTTPAAKYVAKSDPIMAKSPDRKRAVIEGLRVPTIVNNEMVLKQPAQQTPIGTEPMVHVANETLASLELNDVKVIGVDVKDRVAYLDFTPSIQAGMGSAQEAELLKALQLALGQFSAIDRFQIVVDGQPIDTLGHVELTDPTPVLRSGQVGQKSKPALP